MTGYELGQAFFDMRKAGPGPEAAPQDIAMLYGLDEVQVSRENLTLTFPDHGKVSFPALASVPAFDWIAVAPAEGGHRKVMFGRGNPFVPGASNPLPPVQGKHIQAFPYSMLKVLNSLDKPGASAQAKGPARRPR